VVSLSRPVVSLSRPVVSLSRPENRAQDLAASDTGNFFKI
jgi:hypothetical protein